MPATSNRTSAQHIITEHKIPGIGPSFPTELLTALPKLQKLNLYGNEIRTFPHELLHTTHTNLEESFLSLSLSLGLHAQGLLASAGPYFL